MATPSILQTTVGEVTECAICTETMVDPKSLPCIHTYCFKCLDRLWNDKQPGESVPCPLCRTEFVIPVDGVSNLPRNFFVEKLLEAQKLSNTKSVGVMCDMCSQNEEDGDGTSVGEKFCVDCQQNMCQKCFKYHSSNKSLKTHRVYSLENKPDMMDLMHFQERHCDQHKKEQIKIFCTECEVTACVLCFMTQHNGHKCSDIQQVADKLMTQMQKDINETINLVVDVSDETENLQKLLTDFMAKITNTEAMIKEKGEELKKVVDMHVRDLLQDLFAEKTKKIKEIENIKEELMVQKISLESFIKYSEKILEKAVPADIATEAKNLSARAETLKKMEKIRIGNQLEVSFVPSSLHFPALNLKFENNLIGKIKVGGAVVLEASLLCQGVIDFKGHRMFVSSHQLTSMSSNDESYQSYQQTSLPAQASLQGSLMSDTIKVKNIPTSASIDMVMMYFGNSRKSGGGDLELIEWKPEKGKAVFRFHDSKVAMNVVKRSHKLGNADLSVVLLEKPLDGIESYAVEVTGIPKESSEDYIMMYFESRRGGSNTVEEIIWDENVRKAVITFLESDAVTRVLNKCPHLLDGQTMTVMALKPLPPPPLLLKDIDATRLLAKHLPTSVTLEHLKRFVEPVSNSKIAGFTWGAKPGVALVDFCSQPDYFAIRRLVSCKPIQGQMISVQRISTTRSVQVLGSSSSPGSPSVTMALGRKR